MLDFAALFHPLFERSQVVYFVYHLEARQLEFVSPSFETVFGQPCAQATAALPSLISRLHPDDLDFVGGRLAHLMRGKFVEDVEVRLVPEDNASGPVQWLYLTAGRVEQSPGHTYLSGTVQDITSNREYLDDVDKFNKKKNTTLEILSHDLAGPFVMLKQVAGYVTEKVEGLQDSQLNNLLRVMQNTCQESINLIRDFVDNEFLESVHVQMKVERADLALELREMVAEYQKSAEDIAKHFTYEGPGQLFHLLDHNKLMQVINNLLSNAIKFTPDGGHIRVGLQEQPDQVLITVADDGIGIPAKFHDTLFERFTPARRPGLRGEKTTGLGMSIIKTIVELHQGRIWFESAEGHGTTFYIALPRTEPV